MLPLLPGNLKKYAGGKRAGAWRPDEVRGHPVSILHPAVPAHALPGQKEGRRRDFHLGREPRPPRRRQYNALVQASWPR